MNLRWTRVERKGLRAEVYTASSPLGPVEVRQRGQGVTWSAMLGNVTLATGYTSTACKRAAEEKIEAMGRKPRR